MRWDEIFKNFAKKFLERRGRVENFEPSEHSFYIHDPETQFISALLTGYVTDTYYMFGEEVFRYGASLHKEILNKEPDFHIEALEVARHYGAMKDQVAIGLLLWSKHPKRKENFEKIANLLATFPPNYLVKKFINPKRKAKHIFGGLGKFEKALIHKVIDIWRDKGLLEYYSVKYRWYMYDIVRLTHVCLPEDIWKYIKYGTKYDGNNEYLKKVVETLKAKQFVHTFDKPKFPFELVRSNFPKSMWNEWILENTDLTGNTLVLQAVSLYEAIPNVVKFINRAVKSPTVTADKIFKALLVSLHEFGLDNELTKALGKAYAEKVKESYKQLLLPIKEDSKICVVLDASGSMNPESLRGYFIKAISCVAPFSPIIEELILFSDKANYEDPRLLQTLEGILELIEIADEKYNSGTNIVDGLKLALNTECDIVIVVTDEQANIIGIGDHKEVEYIKKLIEEGKTVIILNPTPYPVSVTDIKLKVTYVRAPNPESLAGALRLDQIRKTQKDAKEIIVILKKKIKISEEGEE